jgi:hypothetical protein
VGATTTNPCWKEEKEGQGRIRRYKASEWFVEVIVFPGISKSRFFTPLSVRLFILSEHTVMPLTKCRLRQLRLERIKDYLLLEQEFITNQEAVKPSEEKTEACHAFSFCCVFAVG